MHEPVCRRRCATPAGIFVIASNTLNADRVLLTRARRDIIIWLSRA
ncbi:MAG: hypothetical protein ACRYGM_28160 [Janthinobacterium lividum]